MLKCIFLKQGTNQFYLYTNDEGVIEHKKKKLKNILSP